MGLIPLLKLLWDSKILTTASGYAALILLGYLYLFEINPLSADVTDVKDAVVDLQLSSFEQRLDAAYSALCMNPGDPAILERIRELQQDYQRLAGGRYNPPDCNLLLKLK